MKAHTIGTGFVVLASALTGIADAQAQIAEPKRGETVLTRPRPEIDPLGVRLRSFMLYPTLSVSEEYNDNIFATDNEETDDFITVIAPRLSLQSDWARHALNLSGGIESGLHADNQNQNYVDGDANVDGRLDITRNAWLAGGIGYAHKHELPTDVNYNQVDAINDFDVYDGYVRYNQRFGRFRTIIDGDAKRNEYYNQGDDQDNNIKDELLYGAGARLGYEVLPGYEAFGRVSGNRSNFDTDGGGYNDSYGAQAVFGVGLDLGGVLFGDLFVGYLTQDFDSSGVNDVDAPTFGASLTWNATTLTTVTANINRTVLATNESGADSYIYTAGTLGVDHELLRNLLLSAKVLVANNDFEGSGRNDYVFGGGVGARYMMNRNLYATLGYDYLSRSADKAQQGGGQAASQSYAQNVVRIGLQAQF
jgi:hypothetical protein